MRWYFNFIYNPLYDLSVAQSAPYKRLQTNCLNKLTFKSGESVLCIGVGTGNEITGIIERNGNVAITGIDTSQKALDRAYRKSLRCGKEIKVFKMDAHNLEFANETFDKAVCIHVMGFLEDDSKATQEIVRVLKKGGGFVATYPSGIGSIQLGNEVGRSVWQDLKSWHWAKAVKQCFAIIIGGIAYTPVSASVKPSKGFYSSRNLAAMLDNLRFGEYQIDEDKAYQDYVVWGGK